MIYLLIYSIMGVQDTDRDLSKLDPNFKKKVDLFLEKTRGDIFITEGYRSAERQRYLYNQGKSYLTGAAGSVSNHQIGKAIDIAFSEKGNHYPSEHSRWEKIARIANECGMDWGYDLWAASGFIDKPHFQDNGVLLVEVPKASNRFAHLTGIEASYDDFQLFDNYYDESPVNAGEVKKLLSIGIKRYDDKLKGIL